MAFNKVNFNISALQNLSVPSYSDFNISSTPSEIVNQIPEKANYVTNNYLGLGIMITLFFYLVFKLGDAIELANQPFSTLRSVGISAGVVSILGLQMLSIGYFREYFHVVIFLGILLVSVIFVFLEDRR